MKKYQVLVNEKTKEKLERYISYLKDVKKNPQAAKSVLADYRSTRKELETVAGSLRDADDEDLRAKGIKRINFKKHDYFLLYRTKDSIVQVITMVHSLEDPNNYLK